SLFLQAEDGIRGRNVTGVQTCALPIYFLEEKYPDYGNLVPRDIATREIFDVCVNQKLGINGENMVYLDLSHKDPHELDVKLGGIIEIYEKFVGEDPRKVP